jgi:hypothetical protein
MAYGSEFMKKTVCMSVMALLGAVVSASAADVSQDAIDGCIDALRAQSSAGGGSVVSTEYSEANSLVMLRDASGTEWKCLVGNDGRDPYLERTGTASNDASGTPATSTDVILFRSGFSGTDVSGTLSPGSSKRYLVGGSSGQTLYVEFYSTDPSIEYEIFLPNGRILLDTMRNTQRYEGELFVDGDHIIEVINRGNTNASYTMEVSIQ